MLDVSCHHNRYIVSVDYILYLTYIRAKRKVE